MHVSEGKTGERSRGNLERPTFVPVYFRIGLQFWSSLKLLVSRRVKSDVIVGHDPTARHAVIWNGAAHWRPFCLHGRLVYTPCNILRAIVFVSARGDTGLLFKASMRHACIFITCREKIFFRRERGLIVARRRSRSRYRADRKRSLQNASSPAAALQLRARSIPREKDDNEDD